MSNSISSTDDLNPRVFNVSNITPKPKLPLLIASFILFLITIFILGIFQFSRSNTELPLAGKLINLPISKPKNLQGGSNTPNPTQPKKVSTNHVVVQPENIPNCTSVGKPQFAAPAISVDKPGLLVGDPIVAYYQVFGNTKDQINSQMNNCSPVLINGEKYAASTDYSISWVFNSTVNEQGLCKIQNVSVGVRNAFILPSWQKTANSSDSISNSWNSFIAHLTNHEHGHARLNQDYAGKMHQELQNTPLTTCDNINDLAHARAYAVLDQLNHANNQYDNSTNHGEHEGAIL